jgi:hypothetical protein
VSLAGSVLAESFHERKRRLADAAACRLGAARGAAAVTRRWPAIAPVPALQPAPGHTVHTYALAGGRVTLLITRASVRLVGAAPVPCFSVQTWSTAGWLRVDFSRGTAVSSLIATWNSHAPAVQVFSD